MSDGENRRDARAEVRSTNEQTTPQDRGAPSIFELVTDGDATMLRRRLKERPELARARNEAGLSPLMLALYHRRRDAVAVVREASGHLDLFEAAAVGDGERVRAVLDDEPEAILGHSPDGFTALHLACFFGRLDIVHDLIARGADVDAVADNPMCVRPLHSAAAGGSAEVVQALLEAGSDPDARQHGGWTALMSAAMHGRVDMMRSLLHHGADVTVASDDGRTAIDLAREQDQKEAVALLETS